MWWVEEGYVHDLGVADEGVALALAADAWVLLFRPDEGPDGKPSCRSLSRRAQVGQFPALATPLPLMVLHHCVDVGRAEQLIKFFLHQSSHCIYPKRCKIGLGLSKVVWGIYLHGL